MDGRSRTGHGPCRDSDTYVHAGTRIPAPIPGLGYLRPRGDSDRGTAGESSAASRGARRRQARRGSAGENTIGLIRVPQSRVPAFCEKSIKASCVPTVCPKTVREEHLRQTWSATATESMGLVGGERVGVGAGVGGVSGAPFPAGIGRNNLPSAPAGEGAECPPFTASAKRAADFGLFTLELEGFFRRMGFWLEAGDFLD